MTVIIEKFRLWQELAEEVAAWKDEGLIVVFTNGCFDLIHAGHARYLARSRALGDRLIVAVNSDASLRRLKGPGRPLMPEVDRVEVLAAMACVDRVAIFDQDTPRELIGLLVPHVLVKGEDYAGREVVGRDVVEAAGGRVELVPLAEGRSTSELIRRIVTAYGGRGDRDLW
jgi:D-beta-D-heptose 7-phosphate kinase/D-beta-D-heptose 1-phosphate adenosyltransferase